jgi:hypothetical protein
MKKIGVGLAVATGVAAATVALAPAAWAVAPAAGSTDQGGAAPLSRCMVIDITAPGNSHPVGRVPVQWTLRSAEHVDLTC